MSITSPILIAFGSNIDPLANLWHGLWRLHTEIGLCAISTVYRTPALPDPEARGPSPDFLNGAVRVETLYDPLTLKKVLRNIEIALHRVRSPWHHAPRTLDLDIALMGHCTLQTEALILPDPDILHRPFLAIPLAELAPHYLHPVARVPLSQIATRFPDRLTVDEAATALLQSIMQGREEWRFP